MNMWTIIIGVALTGTICGIIYLFTRFQQFGIVRRISGERKIIRGLLAFIPVLLILCCFMIDGVNLSGHTHGGQMFPINILGELTGANDNTYGYEKRKNTEFIVTSGISCWAIKFKTGTRSEYVVLNISEK